MNVYDSWAEAPLDEPPACDGDDSVPIGNRATGWIPTLHFAPQSAPRSLVVPYRYAEGGDHGDHIYALKRAHARFRGGGRLTMLRLKPPSVKRTWDQYTGPGSFYRDFKETQRRLKVPMTGVYDKATHYKLAPWYDAFALSLLQPDPRDLQIARQLGWVMAFYNDRYNKSYSQARPSQLAAAEVVTRGDCSGSIAGSCWWAKILPRVDWRYTNTWIQIALGHEVMGLSSALPGDVFLYGSSRSNPTHEALYLGNRRVFSFGSYPAKLLDYNYRHDRVGIRRFVP